MPYMENVDKKLSDLFIIDYLTKFNIPHYIIDKDNPYVYRNNSIIKLGSGELTLPMHNKINNKIILMLLKTAIKTANLNKKYDYMYNKIFISKNIDINEAEYLSLLYTNSRHSYIKLDIVDNNCIYLVPEPSYFGLIANQENNKFGIFCLDNLVKINL